MTKMCNFLEQQEYQQQHNNYVLNYYTNC